MELDLAGRRVLVTGGSKGIGLACARAFLAEGARVAIVGRDAAALAEAAAGLPGVATHRADLTDAAEAAAMLEAVEAGLGPLDVVVNSAGAARRSPPDRLAPADWRAAMEAKFLTCIHVADPAVRRMAARGGGVVVNVIGAGGKVASPTHLPGGAANAALMLATAGLAAAWGGQGVRVLGVSPGPTRTTRLLAGLEAEAELAGISPAEAEAQMLGRIPLGRLAEPEEIAQTVVFLASARASYLTGVTLTMDGAAVPVVV